MRQDDNGSISEWELTYVRQRRRRSGPSIRGVSDQFGYPHSLDVIVQYPKACAPE
jgi:hypothetical protein